MKTKRIALILTLSVQIICASAQLSKTYYVDKSGTMISLMTEQEANQITNLTLTGNINAKDFRHLRDEFKNLKVLDLSNANIHLYAGKKGTYPNQKFYLYMKNFIPAYAFCRVVNGVPQGKESLEKVILSSKTINIEDCAFKGCNNLKICQIMKPKAPNLLPEGLSDSITAVFVPFGSSDKYRRKERWESFAILEGKPVEAKLQVGMKESLETAILKAELQPNDINFLTIEGKLDETDFLLIRNYMQNLVSVDISQTNAKAIPEFTFAQKKDLLTIKLPKKLETIGQRAFSDCSRLSGTVVLPENVTSIEYGAFMGCDHLRRVLGTGKKLSTIGENLFGKTNNKLVYKND